MSAQNMMPIKKAKVSRDQTYPKDIRSNTDRLEKLAQYATVHGFQLLETEWLGSKQKHDFKHIATDKIYSGPPTDLMRYGFPKYMRHDNDRLKALATQASSNSFLLLDTVWGGSRQVYTFQHIESGKVVKCRPHEKILKNNNAKILQKNAKTLQDNNAKFTTLVEFAKANGFHLLSTTWLGRHTIHKFKHLDSGKLYESTPNNIKYTGFRTDLRTHTDRLNELSMSARSHGLQLLETEWLGSNTPHRFKHIESGKLYESTPDNIKSRTSSAYLRTPIDRLNELSMYAKSHGFQLLETEWLEAKTPHRFQHIKTGALCSCSPNQLQRRGFPAVGGQRYVTEEVCRQVMKHIFGGHFKSNSYRLKEIHGKNMQLDGFEKFNSTPKVLVNSNVLQKNGVPRPSNVELTEIAFEFQGHQSHYENDDVIARDQLRVEYCQKLGILLVVIDPPDNWNESRNSDYMFEHVCSAIRKSVKTESPLQFPSGFKINLQDWNPDIEAYEDLQDFAYKSGFELISPTWLGSNAKHAFKHIESGKLHDNTPANIKVKGFPKDLRTNVDRLLELSIFAKKNGFELLDTQWKGVDIKHNFKHIESGKVYEWKLNHILGKPGFPKDLRTNADRLLELSIFAKKNGFELLDTQWKGVDIKHNFKHTESGMFYIGAPRSLMAAQRFPKSKRLFLLQDPRLKEGHAYKTSITNTQNIKNLFFDDIQEANILTQKFSDSSATLECNDSTHNIQNTDPSF